MEVVAGIVAAPRWLDSQAAGGRTHKRRGDINLLGRKVPRLFF